VEKPWCARFPFFFFFLSSPFTNTDGAEDVFEEHRNQLPFPSFAFSFLSRGEFSLNGSAVFLRIDGALQPFPPPSLFSFPSFVPDVGVIVVQMVSQDKGVIGGPVPFIFSATGEGCVMASVRCKSAW